MDVFTPTVVNLVPKVEALNKNIDHEKDSTQVDLNLKAPEVQLKVSIPTQTESEKPTQSAKKDIPYWLKPSPVQMYPYNFIMAVRKKLEAISNPAVAKGSNIQGRTSKAAFHETPCPKVDPKKLQNVRRRIGSDDAHKKRSPVGDLSVRFSAVEDYSSSKTAAQEDLDITEKSPEIRDMTIVKDKSSEKLKPYIKFIPHDHLSKSHELPSKDEEYSSDFSADQSQTTDLNKVHSLPRSEETSLSKQNKTYLKEGADLLNKVQPLPHSEYSNFSSVSINIPTNINEDDTTISSSVFSSPEKKISAPEETVASPLNLEVISNLRLKNLPNNITRGRGDFLEKHPLHSKLDVKSKSSTDSVNFSQLLEDFNRSLSHVMDVNSKLKSTLDRSNQIFSPRRAERSRTDEITTIEEYMSSKSSDETTPIKSGKIEDVYTTDFDSSKNNRSSDSILIMKSPVGVVTTVVRKNTALSIFPPEEPKAVVSENVDTDASNNIETDVSNNNRLSDVSKDIETEVSKDNDTYAQKNIDTEEVFSEANIEESPVKDNQSFNQFSRDSLEIRSDVEDNSKTVSRQINKGRGDFSDEKFRINSSISSEFIAVFNNSEIDVDISCHSNYSSVGMVSFH